VIPLRTSPSALATIKVCVVWACAHEIARKPLPAIIFVNTAFPLKGFFSTVKARIFQTEWRLAG